MSFTPLLIKNLGRRAYEPVWREMQRFVAQHAAAQSEKKTGTVQTPGEIWIVEHDPVFTLGSNGKPEHILAAGDIPVVPVDRGGQVTYHGPGQLVVYPLIYLPATSLGVRDLVTALENAVVETLAACDIDAYPRKDAPGVYVDGRKVASIGLRIKKNWCYHGLAFNIDMDLEPFSRINPCGFAGMEITQTRLLGGPSSLSEAIDQFIPHLLKCLGYDTDLMPFSIAQEEQTS